MAKTTVDAATYSAQRGGGIHKWVSDKTASGALQVLTDTTLYHNLAAGEVVMITEMKGDLDTVSDECTFEVVSCTAAAGGGTPTALCGEIHLATAAAKTSHGPHWAEFKPPIRVAYDDGALSITMRINANDSAAVINCGWMGYKDFSL